MSKPLSHLTLRTEEDIQMNETKRLYKRLIVESLGLHLIRPDLIQAREIDQPEKGFNYDQVEHKDLDTLLPRFQCGLCEHVVVEPRRCNTCSTLYCGPCVGFTTTLPLSFGLKPCTGDEFVCITKTCARKKTYRCSIGVKAGPLFDILKEMMYKCRHLYCSFWSGHEGILWH